MSDVNHDHRIHQIYLHPNYHQNENETHIFHFYDEYGKPY